MGESKTEQRLARLEAAVSRMAKAAAEWSGSASGDDVYVSRRWVEDMLEIAREFGSDQNKPT